MPRRHRVAPAADRVGGTQGLAAFASIERHRIYDGASPERREQLRAAERRGAVFAAWNKVVSGTREGAHVTGLHYIAESNELVVYLDAPSWTQEMTMLREIIRARMAAAGAEVAGFVFRTSREGYGVQKGTGAFRTPAAAAAGVRKAPVPIRTPLTAAEDAELSREVAPIADPALREALRKAIKASFEWKKGQGA